MVVLRLVIIFILSMSTYALSIRQVEVKCGQSSDCRDFENSVKELRGKSKSSSQLKRFFRFIANKPYVETLYYEVIDGKLIVEVGAKKKIETISIKARDTYESSKVESVLALKEGDYYDEDHLEKTLDTLEGMVISGDIDDYDISVKEVRDSISVYIDLSRPSKKVLKAISFDVKGVKPEFDFNAFWGDYIEEPWTKSGYKKRLDEFRDYIYELGFWNYELNSEIINYDSYVIVKINLDLGLRYGFNFNGNSYFTHNELIQEFKNILKGRKKNLTTNLILERLSAMYKERGVYFSLFDVSEIVDLKKGLLFFYVNITEGEKVNIAQLNFNGNRFVKDEVLKEVYDDHASDLLGRGFLDVKGLDSAKSQLHKYYISHGYIFSEVSNPVVSFSKDKKQAFVNFKINENYKYTVKKINFIGVKKDIQQEIKKIIVNDEGELFNVDEVDNDLNKAINYIKSRGYFFASLNIKSPKKIIQLDREQRNVSILLDVKLGEKSYLGDVIVTGNRKTKREVVRRELQLKKGELVTPGKINSFVKSLKSLGLFSNVAITPYIADKKGDEGIYLNFIVKVNEKDFGRGEVAPGYRTDIGYKVSTTISYNNLMGMNRSVIWRAQANLRTSNSAFDERRRNQESERIEGLTEIQFVEPYLFDLKLESRLTGKFQRKRFFDFDADIASLTMSLNKEFSEKVSMGLQYELNEVRQYDATDSEDSGRFRIGAITPSITIDLRDKKSKTPKGAWFDFSWEFANPYFLSNDDPELTINYNKALLRSYFYYPLFKSKVSLASAITMGVQDNFATDKVIIDGEETTIGYIPSLKVFRLSGLDLLRGFSDDESNKLIDGTDITDILVRGKAYLFNFKLEPRYYISDNSVVGVFFDAGRIFVDTINFFDLRTSVGATFKFLTPIGSLNFDYGVKLKRERVNSGRESFGRFHVTIGQF